MNRCSERFSTAKHVMRLLVLSHQPKHYQVSDAYISNVTCKEPIIFMHPELNILGVMDVIQ